MEHHVFQATSGATRSSAGGGLVGRLERHAFHSTAERAISAPRVLANRRMELVLFHEARLGPESG
jgi:hypothetical protein